MVQDSDVFGIREAAAFLGAHEQTVRKLARRGAIPAFKVGTDWRFRRKALARWSEEQRLSAEPVSVKIAGDKIDGRLDRARRSRRGPSIAASLEAVHRHMSDHGHHVGASRTNIEDHDLAVRILSLVADPDNLNALIQTVTLCLQKWIGCDAVGVRLREGLDFPYYETRGFPEEFVLAENHLCARDTMNELLRDSNGNPFYECMCGNVICGRFDAAKPFFTEHGSFWSNSTTELLASTAEEDRLARTRNRCNGEGYESVALIPLKLEAEILGLLQINDKSKGFFSKALISLLERVAESVAFVVLQDQALKSRTENDVPVSYRLDGRKGVIVAGRSVLPAKSSPSGVAATMVLEVALDSDTHRVLTVACDGLPKLGQEMLARLLVRKTLPEAVRDAKEGLTNGYYSELRNPAIAALQDLVRNYREIAKRVGGGDPDKPCSVLVVDDEDSTCKALVRIEEGFGCRVRQATSGAKGLEFVEEEVPDLILLDIMMPGMNAPQFLKRLRETHPDLPVVIVTGYPDSNLMKQAMNYAPVMLLGKPVDAGLLERTLRLLVDEKVASVRPSDNRATASILASYGAGR